MGILCGNKCRCKNRCKADLALFDRAVIEGCKKKCKTSNAPSSGQDYLDGLPAYSQQVLSTQKAKEEGIEAAIARAAGSSVSPVNLALGSAALLLIIIIIRKS